MSATPEITSQKTTKFSIPHPHEKDGNLVGVLEQLAPEQPTKGRRIALVSTHMCVADYIKLTQFRAIGLAWCPRVSPRSSRRPI